LTCWSPLLLLLLLLLLLFLLLNRGEGRKLVCRSCNAKTQKTKGKIGNGRETRRARETGWTNSVRQKASGGVQTAQREKRREFSLLSRREERGNEAAVCID